LKVNESENEFPSGPAIAPVHVPVTSAVAASDNVAHSTIAIATPANIDLFIFIPSI